MNIVLLSGSPHRHGTTARLADSFIAGAHEAGHSVKRFDVAFMDIHPCMGCNVCKTEKAKCVFPDDMIDVGEALVDSDCVVFVTPIYYNGFTAQMKTVIDRFFAVEPFIRKNQRTALITAMADEGTKGVEPANASYRAIVSWLDWKDCGILNATGCFMADDLDKTDFEAKAFELGRII